MMARSRPNSLERPSVPPSPSLDSDPGLNDEEAVTIKPLEGAENDLYQREVRISCPDATGLGCDVARMLFDFGVKILSGDMSTDGQWCFLIFKVKLMADVSPHWSLLSAKLQKVCNLDGAVVSSWNARPAAENFGPPFLLSVSSYDRQGFLHDMVHLLWEADVLVYKAHITTSPDGRVADLFWIHDHRGELPKTHRAMELQELIRGCLRQNEAEITVEPAPLESSQEDSTTLNVKRSACVDARPLLPLKRLVSKKQAQTSKGSALLMTTEADQYGVHEEVQVSIDNCTTPVYTVVNIICIDRKGLVYDLMRLLKDIQIRGAYGKIVAHSTGRTEIDLFVQEIDGCRILDRELQNELIERIRQTVTLPVRIDIIDKFDATCTELLVTASLDSGGRGRPRVIYDVTAALSRFGYRVFMADVYIDMPKSEAGQSELERPAEFHRFLILRNDGKRLEFEAEKKALYAGVRAQLMGREPAVQSQPPVAPAQRRPSNADTVLKSLISWNWRA